MDKTQKNKKKLGKAENQYEKIFDTKQIGDYAKNKCDLSPIISNQGV
jgi:hypothetical protein